MRDEEIDIVGRFAGLLAMTEVGLGSVLHAARVPLRGQLLSLNQIFIMMRASAENQQGSRLLTAHISNIAALLKSLSPVGNKLTPMLAISLQGWLFTLGVVIFGHTLVGRIVGGMMASVWAFIQGIVLYGLIFSHAVPWMVQSKMVLWTLCGLVTLKFILVIAMGLFIRKISYFDKLPEFHGVKKKGRGLFYVSVVFTALLLFWAEGSYVRLIQYLLQPIAISFLLFYCMRRVPLEKISTRLSGSWARALTIALQRLHRPRGETLA